MIRLLCLSACLVIVGCNTLPLQESPRIERPSNHVLLKPFIPELNESGLFHLSCTDKYPTGRSVYEAFENDPNTQFSRIALAKRHYLHAVMANNSYRAPDNKPIFIIPNWYLINSLESTSGFGLLLYGNRPTAAESSDLVVAYRGTDFESLDDWGNNLSPKEPMQYKQAFSHLNELRKLNPSAKITVTGHSLGGGIALNMSMRMREIDAVAFNASPRIYFGKTSKLPNYRAHLYELGEGLNGLFGPWIRVRLPNETAYGNYNFLDYRVISFSPVQEHGIYELTRGLILVAMTRGDEQAQRLFAANISEADARSKDWENCQKYFR